MHPNGLKKKKYAALGLFLMLLFSHQEHSEEHSVYMRPKVTLVWIALQTRCYAEKMLSINVGKPSSAE